MRVRALRSFAGNGFAGYKGTELEVPDETGADLIRAGYAEKIEEETEEETTRAAILVAALTLSFCPVRPLPCGTKTIPFYPLAKLPIVWGVEQSIVGR